MLAALREDGQPIETDWPYLAASPADFSIWTPPSRVGPVYRRAGKRRSDGFDEILALLEADQPTLVLMMLSDAFYSPDSDGVVIAPTNEAPDPLSCGRPRNPE